LDEVEHVGGPRVVFDPLHRPIPEIPFPNDLATRKDETSPTGLRLNIAGLAGTSVERRQREGMQRLSGFGTFAPMTVSFSAPLDLSSLKKRHHPDPEASPDGTYAPEDLSWDPSEHAIFLVNVEPGTPHYGQLVPLDLGGGVFPNHTKSHQFWPHDPARNLVNFALPADNLADVDGDGLPEFVYHWEVETNTLIMRPMVPMDQAARHVVVLTRRLVGYVEDGDGGWLRTKSGELVTRAVESPFEHICTPGQEEAVDQAVELLAVHGVERAEVAFAWSFTTQKVTDLLTVMREGLGGSGPFAYLAEDFPPEIAGVENLDLVIDADLDKDGELDILDDNLYIIQADFLAPLLDIITMAMSTELSGDFLGDVDYFVMGSIVAPGFLRTADKRFDLNLTTGEGTVSSEVVPFMLSVPKARENCPKYVPGTSPEPGCPPFPVMTYVHGTQTSRLEMIGIANKMAQMGIACWSLDCVGHGPFVPPLEMVIRQYPDYAFLIPVIKDVLADFLFLPAKAAQIKKLPDDDAIKAFSEVGLLKSITEIGRAEDEDGDGFTGSGESFYVADPFRVRDNTLESVIDYYQLHRVIRALSQDKVPPKVEDQWQACAGLKKCVSDDKDAQGRCPDEQACWDSLKANLLAGDFNADGFLDVGGPDVSISISGTSLGGMIASIIAATDPDVQVAAPVVPGGGMVDIFSRTQLHWVLEPVFFWTLGPVVVGCPVEYMDSGERRVLLSFNNFVEHVMVADEETGKETQVFEYVTDDCRGFWENAKGEAPGRLRSSSGSLPVVPGAKVLVRNITLGEEAEAVMLESGAFSAGVPADIGDRLEISVLSPDGIPIETVVVEECPYEGSGHVRNTPDFRRFAGLIQGVFEAADAINYVPHLFMDPLPGHPPVKVLQLNDVGDTTIPVSAAVAYSRAAGLLGASVEEWYPINEYFRLNGMLDEWKMSTTVPSTGEIYTDFWDCDDVDDNNGMLGQAPPIGKFLDPDAKVNALPTVKVGDGVGAWRVANVYGHHEYIGTENNHPDPTGCCDSPDPADCQLSVDLPCQQYTNYYQNMLVKFVAEGGSKVVDDICIMDNECPLMEWGK